jgi:dienelactone hydrolase
MSNPPALAAYEHFEFDDGRWRRSVYRRGQGPAVIVMHEIPGLHPGVIRFADRVAEAGMTVFLPSLFGQPGKSLTGRYALSEMLLNICIRREFSVWANHRSSPIVDWLRALARKAHAECGGRGVGAVGMCFTGGYALAMMTESAVVAPALSQPSLPMGPGSAGEIDASPEEIACARRRMQDEDLSMIGMRFTSDKLVPDARFARLKREFGERFEAIELADADARPDAPIAPHSVLTLHFEDRPGSRTKAVETRLIAFFKARTGA